ncbi:MAG TPA: MauE/DoxX family redox-associated membrane protein [Candidatus Dormibacteraeota bacterium]
MTLDAARLVLQLALGGVFLVSSAGKARHPLAFVRGVADYEILPVPLAYAFGAVLIPAEAFVAVALLSGLAAGVALPLATGLLVVFAVAVAINLRRHRDVLCHCYGSLGGERLSVRSLVQLALLMGAGLFVWSGGGGTVRLLASAEDAAVALALALACLVAGLWLLHADEIVRLFRKVCKTCSRRPGTVRSLTP